MPVRKIPMNYRNVTGVFPSLKSIGSGAFESTLERDFLTILDFDYEVNNFEVQPVKIEYMMNLLKKEHIHLMCLYGIVLTTLVIENTYYMKSNIEKI